MRCTWWSMLIHFICTYSILCAGSKQLYEIVWAEEPPTPSRTLSACQEMTEKARKTAGPKFPNKAGSRPVSLLALTSVCIWCQPLSSTENITSQILNQVKTSSSLTPRTILQTRNNFLLSLPRNEPFESEPSRHSLRSLRVDHLLIKP